MPGMAHFKQTTKNMNYLGSGCGTVDSAVASNPRGPEFESSHRQPFIEQLFTVCR